jgi:hypothetical protein
MESKGNKDQLRKWFEQTGHEQVPEDFTSSVMKRIEALPAPKQDISPLISGRAWAWIVAWASGLSIAGIYWSGGSDSGNPIWNMVLQKVQTVFEGGSMLPKLPDSFAYCGLALFFFMLLHVLWMRKYLERRMAF